MIDKLWNGIKSPDNKINSISINIQKLERMTHNDRINDEKTRFGLGYKGSKSKLVSELFKFMPKAENFYDLFGGGGAVTDYALYKGLYKNYTINELNELTYKALTMYFNDDFKDEKRWISREDFFKLKDTDPYVAFCYSFGSSLVTYMYNPDKEQCERAFHYAICYDDYSLLDQYLGKYKVRLYSSNIFDKRIELQNYLRNLFEKNICNNLERNPLISFNDQCPKSVYNPPKNLEILNKSYIDCNIRDNSVIYCDIPYKDTYCKGYSSGFNHDEFYDWCLQQTQLVFISEYQMPSDFVAVTEIEFLSTFNDKSAKKVVERLYIPKKQKEYYDYLMTPEDW
jgi:site-specific DNA-adenine methylase